MEWIRMCKVLENEYRIMEKIFFRKKNKIHDNTIRGTAHE